ncbi:MAG: adenylosuccinate synthase [Clostridia bacterium]|nr:adenylosuccinate synthase [Clostridia bacterium]MCL6521850.1 adenylosuccinate synthase [Bacillota bacterium]
MPALVVVGSQWGDEGKGKVTDFLAARAEMVVRYQGGTNAGHTVVHEGREFRLHLVPSGVLHGVTSVLGNGMVIDVPALLQELEELESRGVDTARVLVSETAHLIMPYHKLFDQLEEERRGAARIGTTLRGIGPAYMDKFARAGIRALDLLDPDLLRERLEVVLPEVNRKLERIYDQRPYELEALVEEYAAYGERLRPRLRDTSLVINQAIDANQRVLFEGAQGTLLDIDHGTYPYVTSSSPTAGGACIGSGVGPTRIDRVLGVSKAYSSRVGDGPFPTELHGPQADWLREKGQEYGTTTGRPRRVGWLDLVALRYAVRVSGIGQLAVTKLDTLSGLATIPVCVAYRHGTERLTEMPHDVRVLRECTPEYVEMAGWEEDLGSCERISDLPAEARRYLEFISARLGIPVSLVSVGADRQRTLAVRDPFDMESE